MKLHLTLDTFESLALCEFLQPNIKNREQIYQVLTQVLNSLTAQLVNGKPPLQPRMIHDTKHGTCTAGQHVGKEMKVTLYKYNDKLTQLVIEVDSKFQGQEILEHSEAVTRFKKICKIIK